MRLTSLLGLPASLLVLIATQQSIAQQREDDSTTLEWPFNLPPHAKYWPEDPPHRRRDLEAINEHIHLGRNPVGVMKMSEDEGEMFFLEYWQFEGDLLQSIQSPLRPRDIEQEARLLLNASAPVPLRPPFAPHADARGLQARDVEGRDAAAVLALLQKRGYECPSGTASCSAIGFPDSCCGTGETCYAIQDTGAGGVGCCADGYTCGSDVATCAAGYTSCPSELGGGCCIPGYVCSGVGCVPSAVTVQTTQTITAVSSISTGRSLSTTTVVVVVTSGVVTITPVASTTETYTGLQTTLACTNGYSACPVNAGGGCCLSGRICGSLSCPLPSDSSTTSTKTSTSLVKTTSTTVSTGTGVAPVRPTSVTATSTSTSTATGATCPTGFYACSAYYVGGCCRTGRDCQPTSCAPTSSTTIVSAGVTIIVPVGTGASTASTPAGSCATGWFSCAASEGGNCCPSGYACGTASCSSTGSTATATVAKEGTTNDARRLKAGGSLAAMVLLAIFMAA